MTQKPEVMSLLGVPYYVRPAPDRDPARVQQELLDAEAAWRQDPGNADKLIQYGRWTAYTGRFRDAIDIYSRGIERFPGEAMLYRHRGHRYISIREFERAEADLRKASALCTDSFDIWYHLGLARWLAGDFHGALDAYRSCEAVVPGNDRWVALGYWMYLTLWRLGKKDDTWALLTDLQEVNGENRHYYNLLMYYRGDVPEADLVDWMKEDDTQLTTIGFGVGCKHMLDGHMERAGHYYRRVMTAQHWSSFGLIAAEVEMARLGWSL